MQRITFFFFSIRFSLFSQKSYTIHVLRTSGDSNLIDDNSNLSHDTRNFDECFEDECFSSLVDVERNETVAASQLQMITVLRKKELVSFKLMVLYFSVTYL